MDYSYDQLIELSKKDIEFLKKISLSFNKENEAFDEFLIYIFKSNHLDLIEYYFDNKILSEQELLLTSSFITSVFRNNLFINLINKNKINNDNFVNHCINTNNCPILEFVILNTKDKLNLNNFNESQLNVFIEHSKNSFIFREKFILNHIQTDNLIDCLIKLQLKYIEKNEPNFAFNQFFILKKIASIKLNEDEKKIFKSFIDLSNNSCCHNKNKLLIEQINFINFNFNINENLKLNKHKL